MDMDPDIQDTSPVGQQRLSEERGSGGMALNRLHERTCVSMAKGDAEQAHMQDLHEVKESSAGTTVTSAENDASCDEAADFAGKDPSGGAQKGASKHTRGGLECSDDIEDNLEGDEASLDDAASLGSEPMDFEDSEDVSDDEGTNCRDYPIRNKSDVDDQGLSDEDPSEEAIRDEDLSDEDLSDEELGEDELSDEELSDDDLGEDTVGKDEMGSDGEEAADEEEASGDESIEADGIDDEESSTSGHESSDESDIDTDFEEEDTDCEDVTDDIKKRTSNTTNTKTLSSAVGAALLSLPISLSGKVALAGKDLLGCLDLSGLDWPHTSLTGNSGFDNELFRLMQLHSRSLKDFDKDIKIPLHPAFIMALLMQILDAHRKSQPTLVLECFVDYVSEMKMHIDWYLRFPLGTFQTQRHVRIWAMCEFIDVARQARRRYLARLPEGYYPRLPVKASPFLIAIDRCTRHLGLLGGDFRTTANASLQEVRTVGGDFVPRGKAGKNANKNMTWHPPGHDKYWLVKDRHLLAVQMAEHYALRSGAAGDGRRSSRKWWMLYRRLTDDRIECKTEYDPVAVSTQYESYRTWAKMTQGVSFPFLKFKQKSVIELINWDGMYRPGWPRGPKLKDSDKMSRLSEEIRKAFESLGWLYFEGTVRVFLRTIMDVVILHQDTLASHDPRQLWDRVANDPRLSGSLSGVNLVSLQALMDYIVESAGTWISKRQKDFLSGANISPPGNPSNLARSAYAHYRFIYQLENGSRPNVVDQPAVPAPFGAVPTQSQASDDNPSATS